jgi:hypothetical protein
MIEKIPKSHDNVLGYRASGKLIKTDYEEIMIPGIKAAIKEYGKINFLFYLDAGFKGWKAGALVDDIKLGFSSIMNGISKFAMVGGPKWVQWGMKLDNFIIHGKVKIFSVDQLDEAWDWLNEK